MGRGRHKFDLRKNCEMALKVRIPLDVLKPFVVSLPLTSYVSAPAPNGQALVKRVLVSGQLLKCSALMSNIKDELNFC